MAKASFFMAETVSLTIADVAFGGQGVGRMNGKAVFVPFTIPGEKVTVQIVKQKKNFAAARLLSVEQPAPGRVTPPCPYFMRCGGCSYQHIDYAQQLEIKAQQVAQTLRRVGRLENVPLRPIVASPQPYEYRNRLRVHVTGEAIGFYAAARHEVIDIETCAIAAPAVNVKLRELRRSAVPPGDYTLAIQGRGEFFGQTNDAVAQALAELVAQLVLRDQQTLIDAYCGAGFFAQQLRPLFKKVIGIEENEFAVSQARQHQQPHETYFHGDVASHLSEVLAEQDRSQTTLVLDPPALGVEPRVLDFILAAPPREIVYVSCHPATLARDLAILGRSYTLLSVTPLDMFPQTAEIEVVAHLRREC